MGKRILGFLFVIILFVTMVYGHLTNHYSVTDTGKAISSEQVILWYSDAGMSDYINSISLTYEKESGVKVIPVLVSAVEMLDSIQNASVHEDNGPDIYIITNDSLEKAYLSGLAAEVQDKDMILNTTYYPMSALNAATYNGKILGYPLYFDTSFLVYNKEYVRNIARGYVVDNKITEMATALAGEGELTEEQALGEVRVDESSLTDEDINAGVYEVLPNSLVGILEFADKYDLPETAEGFMEWNVADVLYDYIFAGAYMNIGGECTDMADQVDLYNENAMYALSIFQDFNQFFSIDAHETTYDSVTEDFIKGKTVFTFADITMLSKIDEAVKAYDNANSENVVEATEEGTVEETAETTEETADVQAEETEEELFPCHYGIVNIGMLNDTLRAQPLSITTVATINAYSDKKEEGEAFAKYLAIDAGKEMYARTGRIPAAYMENPGITDYDAIMDTYANSVPLTKIPECSNYWMQAEVLYTSIWNGDDVNSSLLNMATQIMSQVKGEEVTIESIGTPTIEEYYKE